MFFFPHKDTPSLPLRSTGFGAQHKQRRSLSQRKQGEQHHLVRQHRHNGSKRVD